MPGDTDLTGAVTHLLYQEAACLDEQRWDDWLALFDRDVEYWLPAWDSEHETTRDPGNEVSLMYYNGRSGLEDRVFRLRTGRSSASTPLPRTCHMVSNIMVSPSADGTCAVKANWVTHLYRAGESTHYFGRYEYLLVPAGGGWRIAKKKILLLNDYIVTVLDIYSV